MEGGTAKARSWWRAVTLVAAVGLLGAACGSAASQEDGTASGGTRGEDGADELVVVTTVAPLTSLASAVAGDRAEVRGIVPEGVDSHTYEPSPSVAALLEDADVVFLNGLGLEEPTRQLAASSVGDEVEIVLLGERTITEDEYVFDDSFPASGGHPNPHLWTNPPMALEYADHIRTTLSDLDPDGADVYQANYDALAAAIGELDAALRTSLATVPPAHRKLLTYHDAFAYFAREYGWEVVGAIQMANFDEPSPREVARLIAQVQAEGLPAIFGSEVFPSPVLEQIGREAGVRYVDVLRDDDLPGEPGDPEHSLLELLRDDYVVITEALGGDASALEALDLRLPVPDRATYPQ